MTSPAYQYGKALGELQKMYVKMFNDMGKGFKAAFAPVTPEVSAERQYARRIRAERDLGMAHVRNEARRVRRELGL